MAAQLAARLRRSHVGVLTIDICTILRPTYITNSSLMNMTCPPLRYLGSAAASRPPPGALAHRPAACAPCSARALQPCTLETCPHPGPARSRSRHETPSPVTAMRPVKAALGPRFNHNRYPPGLCGCYAGCGCATASAEAWYGVSLHDEVLLVDANGR